ncbi:glutamate-cysteine ligase family protein [Cryobacterium fucosi]|uniref:Uncharacterized protein n=1 Tax=Cryobacterium fucosi TaxID=1259157 RepID=A0A4R9B0D3_9MICO|nr:glutamate-cysteine ligase family protein [Cryobacterium fucosi]TFD73016.1 hypothetical protein E3T48_14900 [Cryobacterium fucosi]
MRTFEVEEELLIVDPVLAAKFRQEQIEVQTSPCSSLDGLLEGIRRGRDAAGTAAWAVGAGVAALATSPLARGPRYAAMMNGFGLTAREPSTSGLHVHVSVGSDEEGVAVLDRIRIWLDRSSCSARLPGTVPWSPGISHPALCWTTGWFTLTSEPPWSIGVITTASDPGWLPDAIRSSRLAGASRAPGSSSLMQPYCGGIVVGKGLVQNAEGSISRRGLTVFD